MEKGGLLLSEYRIKSTVNRYNLVARDRLQAGLALATLVVQTGVKGGTMHAANTTLMAKKELCVSRMMPSTIMRNAKEMLICMRRAQSTSREAMILTKSLRILRTRKS